MARITSFTAWLKRYRNADTAIGDLAGDVAQDPGWPSRARSIATFRAYLDERGASPEALATLDDAWAKYQRDKDWHASP